MANLRINRLWFWILVVVYFVIKIPLGNYVAAHIGEPNNLLTKLDTPLVIALAIAVAARLNDAGRRYWPAMLAMFFLFAILPLALVFGYIAAFPKPDGTRYNQQEFMDTFFMLSTVPGVLLIALLIWTGTRPSKPAPSITG
jgi:uncharacterized membrane protein YhaH (DUF805 family)